MGEQGATSPAGGTLGPKFRFVWGRKAVWSATSERLKRKLERLRKWAWALSLAAAALATVASQFEPGPDGAAAWPVKVIGIASACFLAVGTYLTQRAVGSRLQDKWIAARSVVEALKACLYQYRTRVPPYVGNAADRELGANADALEAGQSLGVDLEILGDDQLEAGLPTGFLDMKGYLDERVLEQAAGFYGRRAKEYQTTLRKMRSITFALGLVAVLFGAVGPFVPNVQLTVWVAVITTATASIGTYLASGRYEYLVMSYGATARRLRALKSSWEALPDAEQTEQKRIEFVAKCEEAISVENASWIAQHQRKAAKETAPAP